MQSRQIHVGIDDDLIARRSPNQSKVINVAFVVDGDEAREIVVADDSFGTFGDEFDARQQFGLIRRPSLSTPWIRVIQTQVLYG